MPKSNKHNANGFFTMVDNRLFDSWLEELDGDALKCLLYLIRQTQGWHKEKCIAALDDIAEAVGMSIGRTDRALKRLANERLIRGKRVGDGPALTFSTRFYMG